MRIFLLFSFVGFVQLVFAQTPCENGFAGTYPCRNVDLLAFVPLSDIGSGASTNDIWGWVSPVTAKEYALVGCSNGTAFVDITDPTEPVYVGLLPTHSQNSLWRDLESFGNYCYVVSEAPNHGLQVFDLLQLDAVTNPPVEFDETAHYGGFGNCHTLNIDPATGFVICMGSNTYDGGLHIVDASDPLNPFLAGGFATDGYTHDGFAWTYDGPDPDWQGKELVFACNEDELTIVDITDKTDCQAIASYDYEGQAQVGYIHQGWITKDKSHFLVDDELDEIQIGNDQLPYGTRTHMFDITDLDNVSYQGYHEANNTSIDHNLYVLDQFVYASNYRSGVRIFDAVNIDNDQITEVGYFDLFPTNDFAQFSGTWSNYPYLPSGVNIATSMYEGFFILQPKLIVLSQDEWTLCGNNELIFDVQVNANIAFPVTFDVSGLGNATVTAEALTTVGAVSVTISGLSQLNSDVYNAKLLLQTTFGETYEVPFILNYANNQADAPLLSNVPDNAIVSNGDEATLFTWLSVADAQGYVFELASDETFESIIEVQNVSETNYLLTFDLPDGTYHWRVRAINGCGDGIWSEVFSFSVMFVGVSESQQQTLRVYPNPVEDLLMIESDNTFSTIALTDATGRPVMFLTGRDRFKEQFDVSALSPGIYFLEINNAVARILVK
jgi:choice-of-anchor B domain-containing protein